MYGNHPWCCVAWPEVRVEPDEPIYSRDGEQLKYHILHQRVVVLTRRGSRSRLLFFLPDKLVPAGSPPPVVSSAECDVGGWVCVVSTVC